MDGLYKIALDTDGHGNQKSCPHKALASNICPIWYEFRPMVRLNKQIFPILEVDFIPRVVKLRKPRNHGYNLIRLTLPALSQVIAKKKLPVQYLHSI